MTTRQPYRPKYIPLYAARTEKKDIEPPALKLEQQDISELRQQIDDFREEIRTSPVSYPKQPMADPHRRFAIPTDLSRFERLRRGLRREEDADINLGANYSRYRLETRRNMEEEEVPDTRTTRVSKRGRDHNEQSTSQTRLRSNSRSRNSPQELPNNLHAQLDDDFEEDYPEIKHESDYEDASMPNPIPQLRRYAGYNAFTGSPQKKVTIREPEEETPEKHTRPRSRSSDSRAEARLNEATRLVEEKLEQYMGAIEASKGPEVAQQFVREYQLMMDLLSEDYQGLADAKQKQSAKSASKPVQKSAPKPAAKPATTKKGIIKKRTQPETRKPAEDVFDDFEEDIEEDYEEIDPRVKLEEEEEDNELVKDYRRAQESMHELEKEFRQTLKPRDQHTSQKLDIPSTGFWTRTRSTISRSCRVVAGAWYTTTSPLLLLATSFFFWQAIRLYVYASLIIFPLYLN